MNIKNLLIKDKNFSVTSSEMKYKYLVMVTLSGGKVQRHHFTKSYDEVKEFFQNSKDVNEYAGCQVYQKMFTNECDIKINAHETYVLKMSWGKKADIKEHVCTRE